MSTKPEVSGGETGEVVAGSEPPITSTSCTINPVVMAKPPSRPVIDVPQNESSSDTVSSRGKGEDFETKLETDRGKRFDYLLKQTEIFSHFMNQAKGGTPKAKSGRPKKVKEDVVE